MKKVIINIDDLGLSEAVNQAVVNLADKQRITASSYMVGGSISDEHKQALQELGVDIGLHLDFTGIFPSPLTGSLKSTLFKCYTHQLDKQQVADNIKQQFEQFVETFDALPVFVDGHQHVHQFPIIRDALIQEIMARTHSNSHIHTCSHPQQTPIACRVTKPLVNDLKSWIIYLLGGNKWQMLCQANGIATNTGFAGVYGFDKDKEELKKRWQTWLTSCSNCTNVKSNTESTTESIKNTGNIKSIKNAKSTQTDKTNLIMCHPATPIALTKSGKDWQDEIKQAREIEYQWLMSDEFAEMLSMQKVQLQHWTALM